MTRARIYLDYAATTPVDPKVVEAMLPTFRETFGNPSSSHAFGRDAQDLVMRARTQVADLVGAMPQDIVFTSGSTEAINIFLRGVYAEHTGHLVTSTAEHKAVLDTAKSLADDGVDVTLLEPQKDGTHDVASVVDALREDTKAVALMWGNNETGALAPIEELAKVCAERDILCFTDATQAVGKIPIDIGTQDIDALALSAHKLYGPKGAGALIVRRRAQSKLRRVFTGGGQEHGLRPGTTNVPGVVGLGEACALAHASLQEERARLQTMRDRLDTLLRVSLDGVYLNGSPEHHLPHILNVSFDAVPGEMLMTRLRDVATSVGSACNSMQPVASHVMRAMRMAPDRALGAFRVSVGRYTTDEELAYAAQRIIEEVRSLRKLNL
ncbi:MAG: cysteine desulfurase family protein [Myxococcota bacterium]